MRWSNRNAAGLFGFIARSCCPPRAHISVGASDQSDIELREAAHLSLLIRYVIIKERKEKEGQSRRTDQSADDHRGKRTLNFGAVDVATAMGMKPRLATSAVIRTGRKRRRAPDITASRM